MGAATPGPGRLVFPRAWQSCFWGACAAVGLAVGRARLCSAVLRFGGREEEEGREEGREEEGHRVWLSCRSKDGVRSHLAHPWRRSGGGAGP